MGGNLYGYNNSYGMPNFNAQYPAGMAPTYAAQQNQTGMSQYPAMSQDQVMLNNFYSSPNGQFAASINNQVQGVTYGNDAFVHNALLADAQWKQQQAATSQGTAQQPATGTQQPNSTQPTGTQPTTGTQQQPANGAQQPVNTDVTKWDYSNPKTMATNSIAAFTGNNLSQGQQDYAALQFLLKVKNNDVKDRKDNDMNDDKYSQDDIQLAINLANDQKNPGLAASLGRIKEVLNNLDYANGNTTGKKNLTERDDLEKVAKFIQDNNMSVTATQISAQLSEDTTIDDLKKKK
jgi:hypothetical protein